jgi:RimJ/RimL family protein N-acetyltransferase
MFRVVPFTSEDITEFLTWVESPRFLLQMAGPKLTYENLKNQYEKIVENSSDKNANHLLFKTESNEYSFTCGHFELIDISPKHKTATVGRIVINPSLRGKGHGMDQMNAILETAFVQFNLHRLQLSVYDFNTPAIKTL